MTGEELLECMEYVDADLVEMAERPVLNKKRHRRWIGMIAACLAIVIGIYSLIPNRTLFFTPFQIVDLMIGEGETAGDTQRYLELYMGADQKMLLAELPDTEYVPVFYKNKTKLPKSENMMAAWLNPIFERMADSFGVETLEGYDITTSQGYYNQHYSFILERSRDNIYSNCEIRLDGELICVDPSSSDEEILASLESVKKKLFAICGREFSDAQVIRQKITYEHDSITIVFYDESAHPLNKYLLAKDNYRLVSDRILLVIDEFDYQGTATSADERVSVKIHYYKRVMSPDHMYQTRGKVKLISLEKAEEMLEKGYVFAPGCDGCMSMQPGVDFSNYDYVSFEYLQDAEAGSNWILPFYAFYKELAEDPNGTVTYAKTYVCAMEVPGLEAYFESQRH